LAGASPHRLSSKVLTLDDFVLPPLDPSHIRPWTDRRAGHDRFTVLMSYRAPIGWIDQMADALLAKA